MDIYMVDQDCNIPLAYQIHCCGFYEVLRGATTSSLLHQCNILSLSSNARTYPSNLSISVSANLRRRRSLGLSICVPMREMTANITTKVPSFLGMRISARNEIELARRVWQRWIDARP
ncbi:hypothetical protein L202_07007 [Cryptococcus amylolentus CBS 6039]|uniref:Uncharacterized protein n=1 Tax=Cryptococcus amylolentus CBS 6039 TaxID=1295533 RepID=A0A1E3HE96_9TREE|nr:hypothetical protein L202_07007 [Cryptococcus amylolentus CBS 6039]ODN74670.1 hypothetical protein L202_07007 [Cryptococcus amylolentus CBS 6039]